MTPEHWQQIKEVFYAALERPPGERASFIATACAGDESARREISQLISAHDQSDGFLEAPAFEVAARSLDDHKPAGLAEGQVVGRYRVIGSLGAGGMGEVYLAADTRLRRKVALKLLPASFTAEADRVRRFEREACAASALNHPNVCTIHEVGEAEEGRRYIVMEHVEGVTLRQHTTGEPLEVMEALDVAVQIASGLSAAHAVGVVHRDVKPENVMLRPDGIVKVLDFGLAKLTEQQPAAADSVAPTRPRARTETGMVMGTPHYMSPEQARGEEVDARTDIWSLGVVLYEMVTGRAPFEGETPSHVIVSILDGDPPPLSPNEEVPAGLERILAKALRKGRAERYQTAGDLALDLKRLKEELEVEARLRRGLRPNSEGKESAAGGGFGANEAIREREARTGRVVPARSTLSVEYLVGGLGRHKILAAALLGLLFAALGSAYFAVNHNRAASVAGGKRSIAVLPLKPIGAAGRDEVYEVGVADSLIHRLSSMKGFVVRPLSAMRKYAGVEQDPLAAGREQQADYVLASNYQLAAGKIRITAQLLHVASGQVEETYKSEKDAGDVFAMQDAVADEVGNLFLARFATSPSGPTAKRGTTNEEAYRLYLQGMYLVEKENLADIKRAVELFDQALSLDPNYAQAWAVKARAHCAFAHYGGSSPDAEFAKAKPALERALALDANLPEAHAVLGIIRVDYDWNFAEGEKHLRRATEIAPHSDVFHRWYAHRLSMLGRPEEAIDRIKIAIDLNPTSVFDQNVYGHALYSARRYDDAIMQMRRVAEMDSANSFIYRFLWQSYHMKGDHPRAYESFMRFQQLIGAKDEALKSYETAYAEGGWPAVLLRNLEVLKAKNASGSYAYPIAAISALTGQREQSFLHLNDAVKSRSLWIPQILGDPALDSLRGDPRFAELVGRVESQRR